MLISALLVALIVIATFNGFDAATRATSEQRHHDQAALLAAQSQEQLRSDPASALDQLETAEHSYTQTVDKTTYTIKQKAEPISASGSTSGCKFSETTAQNGAYIQITSTVTWPQLKRAAVRQSSLITPPVGSDLEVDVSNGAATAAGVSGVTAIATFTPAEASGPSTIEGTTGANGCVVLTGIQATSATISIAEKAGFVTPNGQLKWPTKEVTLAPNLTTHYPVTYNEAGKITAEYTYKGLSEWEGKPVRSDTFVAYNTKIPAEPKFEVGAPENNFEYATFSGEEQYKALTTLLAPAATTPHGTTYPGGDLFPFAENNWQVYAGDCPANSVATVTASSEKLANPNTSLAAGQNAAVKVPLSYLALNLKSGTHAKPGALESTVYQVTITDTACNAAKVPNNAFAANLRHVQSTTTSGHLGNPFQPWGAYELCLTTANRLYKAPFNNTTVAGSELTVYPNEPSKAGYESKEAEERTNWKTKEAKGELKLAERTAKENTQKTEKTQREKEEGERGYNIEVGEKC